jgi:signal transduction histidine kinase
VSLAVGASVILVLGVLLASDWTEFRSSISTVLPWLVVVAVADLMPVPIWGSVEMMMSFPVLLAAAFAFPPHVAGLLSFVGTVDARELRHEISASRTLFNRSNVTLSVMAASWVYHAMGGDVLDWPRVLPISTVSLTVDLLINASLLVAGSRLVMGLSTHDLIQKVYGGAHPIAFVVAYACFGLLAVVLGTIHAAVGAWGLVAFAIPLLLARQMFVHWKGLAVAELRLHEQRQLLTQVSSRIADERREERLAVAAGIHDEVLPPIYKVHLMGQVLRQDLASGRLLDLEADIPDLLRATEAASGALRDLVGDLRKSTLGPGGLVQTLQLLTRKLREESNIAIELEASELPGSALTHLLLYQVAREALTNTVRHSQAKSARVVLEEVDDGLRMTVEDDGQGFDPIAVDDQRHFGMQLMRERVELAGGIFFVEAAPANGTRIIVKVPVDRPLLT